MNGDETPKTAEGIKTPKTDYLKLKNEEVMEAGLPKLEVPPFFLLSKCYNAIRESIIALVQANTLTHNTGMGRK